MVRLKNNSIQLVSIHPALSLVLAGTVSPIYTAFGHDCVITSGGEFSVKHSKTSLHYAGCAVDIRTTDPQTGKRLAGIDQIIKEIKAALNIDFDVIDEGDHLHIEFQPKRRG